MAASGSLMRKRRSCVFHQDLDLALCDTQSCQCLRVKLLLRRLGQKKRWPSIISEILPYSNNVAFLAVFTIVILESQVSFVWSYVAKIISAKTYCLIIFIVFFLRRIVVLSFFHSLVFFEFEHHIVSVGPVTHRFSVVISV